MNTLPQSDDSWNKVRWGGVSTSSGFLRRIHSTHFSNPIPHEPIPTHDQYCDNTVLFFFSFNVWTHKTPTKNHVFCILFISDLTVSRKMIILIFHSSYGKFLEAVNSQNPLCWIRCTSQVAHYLFLSSFLPFHPGGENPLSGFTFWRFVASTVVKN